MEEDIQVDLGEKGLLIIEVKGIGGLIMITQYDIPWRDDIFDGWHFYDASQSIEFIRKGFAKICFSTSTIF